MKPFSLFGKKIPAWVPAGILAIGIIGAVVYAASKADDWRTAWLEKQPIDVRLALNDESLLCSNEYYSTRYSSFKYDDENTIEMILAEVTEVKEELATWEESLANYSSLDTDDWTEEMLEDRPEAIKHYKEKIEDLNKKLEQLEEQLKQLEDEVHIESSTPPARREIDTRKFINNALSSEEGYPRDTLITFDTESWLKYQAAVHWEFLSNTAKEEYFTEYGNFRPAYKYYTSSPIMLPFIGDYLGNSPYFDATLAEKVSESKYDSIYIEEEDTYYIEVPGDYKNSSYKAVDTLKGVQCIEFLRKIPSQYEDDISFIREFPELKYLSITNPNHAKYLRYAGKLLVLIFPKVNDLRFLNSDFNNTPNPQLVDLKYLKLGLSGISDIRYIENRLNLEYLTLEIGGATDSLMTQKPITETLAGINWPKLKYLKIKGAISSSFIWMTKFDTLEMLDLDVTYDSSSALPRYKRCGDPISYRHDPSARRIINPLYQALQLLYFKELNLKELYITAKDLKQSDCDILENTLENTEVVCRATYIESCPKPGLVTGNVLALYTQRTMTAFDARAWRLKVLEEAAKKEEDMSEAELKQFNYDMNVLKDKYLSGYNLVIKIGENGILQGEYKLWGSQYEDADKQSCAELEGQTSFWLSQTPAIGGCRLSIQFERLVDILKEYEEEPLVNGLYCPFSGVGSRYSKGGKCTDDFKIEGDIIRSESGSQINYRKISTSGNKATYLGGKHDSDEIGYQKASEIASWLYYGRDKCGAAILRSLNKVMEPCCSGDENVCLGPGSADNYTDGCKIGPELKLR